MIKFVRTGFSLIEMIVVLVIIGIIASTLVPLLDTQQMKIAAGQRFAGEILNVISAEKNYYMNEINASNGQHEFTDLETLISSGYLGKEPSNPFYDENISVIPNNNPISGTKNFTITFKVPKDTAGVFFNSIPGLEQVSENGNELTLKVTTHIPGLSSAFDNLMHRDSGVDQELRTSHGPIQVTDNVSPQNSYISITDDNTKTPQELKEDSYNSISDGFGIVKIGSITDNLDFGIIGGNKDGKLIISANRNETPGELYLGYDDGSGVGSNRIILGLGNLPYVEVSHGGIYFSSEDPNKPGTSHPVAKMQYGNNASNFYVYNNTGKGRVVISSLENGNAIMEFSKNTGNPNETEFLDYSDPSKPISFIGSIGGIFTVSKIADLPTNLYGRPCANGMGAWRYVVTGVLSFDGGAGNSSSGNDDGAGVYNYELNINGNVSGENMVGINIQNIEWNFKVKETPKYFTYLNINYNGCVLKTSHVSEGKMVFESHPVNCRFTVFLMCLPNNNRKYNGGLGFFKSF